MALDILHLHGHREFLMPSTESFAAVRAAPFCDCVFPRTTEMLGFKGNIHEHIHCKCGENEGHPLDWKWDKESADPECYINGTDITFHPTYSQGTTIVRGEKALEPGMVHFWEMKIITSLSGTETMVGIGTDKVKLLEYRFRFASALGMDNQSWGYSFRGKAQHNSETRLYGKPYSQGCLVGVYLDMTCGYLEFYLNRRSLGIAYRNIPIDSSVKIYPMACSTAANASLRLINSTSCADTLQLRSMRQVARNPSMLANLTRMPGLRYLSERYWYLIPYQGCTKENREILSLEDEAILRARKAKKLKMAGDIENITDLYENAHTIKHRKSCNFDSDEDDDDEDIFTDPSDFLYFFCDH